MQNYGEKMCFRASHRGSKFRAGVEVVGWWPLANF